MQEWPQFKCEVDVLIIFTSNHCLFCIKIHEMWIIAITLPEPYVNFFFCQTNKTKFPFWEVFFMFYNNGQRVAATLCLTSSNISFDYCAGWIKTYHSTQNHTKTQSTKNRPSHWKEYGSSELSLGTPQTETENNTPSSPPSISLTV